MTDIERFRRRLEDVGAEIPGALVELVAKVAGPLLTRHEQLLDLDLEDVEPFCPARRLPDDAIG